MNSHTMRPSIRWIAPPERQIASHIPIEICYFKSVFDLSATLSSCEITISANSRFCLYINGKAVLDGPCKGDEWYHYCDKLDIASWLKAGQNVIAAKVVAYPAFGAVKADMSNAGPCSIIGNSYGPMFYLDAPDIEAELSTGKADWQCMNETATGWTTESIPLLAGGNEVVNGALIPHGWESSAEFAQGFVPAASFKENNPTWGEMPPLPLYERPIPLLLRKTLPTPTPLENCRQDLSFPAKRGAPITVAANQCCELTLDTGSLTTAFLSIAVSGGQKSRIRIGYAESFAEKMADGSFKKERRDDSSQTFFGIWDTYCPSGDQEIYRPFWFRTFRFLRIIVETGTEPLTLYPPELTETRYPLEDTLQFELPDLPWGKPLYDISLRTLQLCMHETYEDCPFYEQLQYVMDTRLQILFTYAVSGDTQMARRTLDDFHRSLLPGGISQSRYPSNYRQVIPLFSLHWILILLDYYEQTADRAVLEEYRPTVERILHWFHRKTGAQGLIEQLGHWEFVDWTTQWASTHGVPTAVKTGASSINNFFYAYVLSRSTELFRVLGFHDLAEKYSAESAAIAEKTAHLCWDNEHQLYREGPEYNQFSQHAQIYAVLCGAVKGAPAKQIMTKALHDKSLVQCSFVMQFYLFRALEQTGLYSETETLWSQWRELLNLNMSTVPEIPGPSTRSDCHAWGSLLLYELPRRIFGVTPMEPGYRTIRIAPCAPFAGDFDAKVPTPRGVVELHGRWRDGHLSLRGISPVPCLVILPDGRQYQFAPGEFNIEEHKQ